MPSIAEEAATEVLTGDAVGEGEESGSVKPTPVPTAESLICLQVLRLIRQAQQQHGLRHGDFQRYRGYCSRRIRRLRKAVKFVQGDKKHFRKKDVTPELVTDERFLLITLVTAERAWSYSMQMKEEATTEQRKKFRMISRLRKAVHYAQMFDGICQQSPLCDAMTKLEAQAYSAWMVGTLHFELQLWRPALEELTKAQTIYGKLMEALPEEDREPYQAKLAELRPSLRFCAYNIGDQSAAEDLRAMKEMGGGEGIDHLIAQTRERQAATLSEITWRGKTVPVRNEKVRLFLLELNETESVLEKESDPDAKISMLEDILFKCKDVQQGLREEMKADPTVSRRGVESANMAAANTGVAPGSQHLSSYLTWIRLQKTIQKTLSQVDSCQSRGKKAQDFIRLYDNLLQCYQELQGLASSTGKDAVEEEELGAKVSSCRALRSLYIALTLSGAKRWAECMAMCHRAQAHAKTALATLPSSDALRARVEEIESKAEAEKLSAHANVMMGGESAEDTTPPPKSDQYLINRLDEWISAENESALPPLVPFPPPLQPVSCKPLFFDLALNHVALPSLVAEVEEKRSAQDSTGTTGLTGFVKGLWGWKK